jgi:HEAT repeat protein
MRNRGRIAVAALVTMLVGVSAWLGLRQREPVYSGKPLTLWLRTYAPSGSSGLHSREWNEADNAVRRMGTNCIPTLLHMLRQKDSPAKLWLVAFAQKHGLAKRIHFVPATERNVEASRAFIALGNLAKCAIPALVEMLDDNISDEARCAIEDALAWIGPAAEPAIPLLFKAATNANPRVRASALWALGEIHAQPESCVPCLICALNDSDDWARLSAAHALGRFGPDAKSAVPSLTELTNVRISFSGVTLSTRMQVQLEARNALRKIDPVAYSPAGKTSFDFGIPNTDSPISSR